MRTRAVRPRWTWLFMRSTACWSWDARATSASPEPGRGWGDCVHTPDRCTTLAREAREDRRPDRAPRAVPRVPAGRGGGAAGAVRRDPAPDRPPARTARGGGLTGVDMERPEPRG